MGPAGDHGGTSFSVIEGKSLELALVRHELEGLEWLREKMQQRERELEELRFDVGRAILGMSCR
jgi:hypothetical protein